MVPMRDGAVNRPKVGSTKFSTGLSLAVGQEERGSLIWA